MVSPLDPNLPYLPQGPDRVVYLEANRAPTIADTKYRDSTYYKNNTEWRDNSVIPPDIWKLAKINSKVDATWVKISGSSGPLLSILPPLGLTPIIPTAAGAVTFTSTGGSVAITGVTGPGAGDHTINFDLTGGGIAVDQINVDANTAPGTDPVVPTAAGQITVTGGQVASGVIGANVIRTDSLAANTYTIEIQRSAAVASTASANNGVSHYYNGQFSVDANGFVQLAGGSGPAVQKINVDANTAPGTDPVLADGSGQIIVTGGQVAAGTVGANVIRTDSLAANTYTIEVQRSAAVSSTASANNGVSHYDSHYFAVDSNGFVQSKTGLQLGVSNLGIAYSAGTFTVQGADGTALSASNPAYVTLQSATTPGRLVTVAVTSNSTFTDAAGSGQITGNSWGTTAGSWGVDCPFYLYAIIKNDNSAISFAFCRVPNCPSSSATIAYTGSATASTQGAMFGLGLAVGTVAAYQSQPCLLIGIFRMRKASVQNWVVQALSNNDGIGQFGEQSIWLMESGKMGASAGSYWSSSVGGDTIPIWSAQLTDYTISKDGSVKLINNASNLTTGGVGAGNLRLSLPLVGLYGGANLSQPGSLVYYNNVNYNSALPYTVLASPTSYCEWVLTGAAAGKLTPGTWAANISMGLSYTYLADYL